VNKTAKRKGIQSQEALLTLGLSRRSNILYFQPAKILDKLRHGIETRREEERKGKTLMDSRSGTTSMQAGSELGGER